MATFEFKTRSTDEAESINAAGFFLNTKESKLDFHDINGDIFASYAIGPGAYVKKIRD